MKIILLFATAWLAQGLVICQNLVPNFSFEEYKACDFIQGGIDTNLIAAPVVKDWASASVGGTPDYFHPCQLPPSFPGDDCSVPKNANGFQMPQSTGMAYSGILLTKRFSPTVNAREYIQTKLKKRLVKGQRYCAGFYTSFANQDSAVTLENATLVAPVQWGLFLSVSRPFNATDPFLNPSLPTAFYVAGIPQIKTNAAITDTANWVLVSDIYQATGNEEWLTIGNFNPLGQTVLDTFYNAYSWAVSSYYYIDNVFVIPMDDGGLLPGDTALCETSFPLQLAAFDGFSNYSWGNGETAPAILINEPGTYTVSANYEGCHILDTITIATLPPPVLDLPPLHICEDEIPYTYTIPDLSGFDDFQWSNGTHGASITVNNNLSLTVLANGKCGNDTDTLLIGIELPLQVDLGEDFSVCKSGQIEQVTLQNSHSLPNYGWSTGDTLSSITVDAPGIYTLSSTNACGLAQDEVVLSGCQSRIYVPNVVYPGSLYQENYLFRPFAVNPGIISMLVFDRWGGKMYYGEGGNAAWDGTRNGQECTQGVYAYLIKYRDENGHEKYLHGDVQLIR